jgi:hypothetical protein
MKRFKIKTETYYVRDYKKLKCHKKWQVAPLWTSLGIEQGRFYQCKKCGEWLTRDPFYIKANKEDIEKERKNKNKKA